jgi:hypothetical protein
LDDEDNVAGIAVVTGRNASREPRQSLRIVSDAARVQIVLILPPAKKCQSHRGLANNDLGVAARCFALECAKLETRSPPIKKEKFSLYGFPADF